MATLNTNTYDGISEEQRSYYDLQLLLRAEEALVHNQFGKETSIPKNKGDNVQWRRWEPLDPATTPLSEGVTPDGNSLSVAEVTATLSQYGDYVTLSDKFQVSAIDPVVVETVDVLGQQAGVTLDHVTRDVINAGSNVQYGEGDTTARHLLVGGGSTISDNDYLSWNALVTAVGTLKRNKAKPFTEIKVSPEMSGGGNSDMPDISMNDAMKSGLGSYTKRLDKPCYWGIIHPDVASDLSKYDDDWKDANAYDASNRAVGEVGMIHGVRFVESTEAKIFVADDLLDEYRTVTADGAWSSKTVTVDEAISSDEASALEGRSIYIDDAADIEVLTIDSVAAGAAGAATITVEESPTTTIVDGTKIYPGEAGVEGRQVYSTLVFGQEAYGTVKLAGQGVETIIKQLGASGVADALNQRSSVGWKAYHAAKILNDLWIVRIETTSTEESGS